MKSKIKSNQIKSNQIACINSSMGFKTTITSGALLLTHELTRIGTRNTHRITRQPPHPTPRLQHNAAAPPARSPSGPLRSSHTAGPPPPECPLEQMHIEMPHAPKHIEMPHARMHVESPRTRMRVPASMFSPRHTSTHSRAHSARWPNQVKSHLIS